MKDPLGGWIYIFFTSSDYARCKIGKTINNPLIRFRNLRTADPYLAVHVAYFIPEKFGSIFDFESSIHFEFKDHRIETYDERKSEWFKVSAKMAEMWIDGYLEEWCDQKMKVSYGAHEEHLTKMFESDINDLFKSSTINDFFPEFDIDNIDSSS